MPLAPGFIDLEYLFSRNITDEVGWQVINDAVTQSAQLHAAALDQQLALFCEAIDPTKFQYKFRLPVTVEMQPLQGAKDSPAPVRGYDEYDIAVPMLDVGLAWGDDRKSRAYMTVEDANNNTYNAAQADSRWQRRQILTALLYGSSYPFSDPDKGSLTIKPLANSDTDKYNRKDGTVSTDNHYLAQAAAISSTDYPFDDINDELPEHPDNMGEVVVYTAKNLASSIKALPDFIPFIENTRVQTGSSTDVLNDFPVVPLGDRRMGYLEDGDCYVVRWDALPSNYMVAMMTQNSKKPLAYRDEVAQSLRGLRTELNSADGNSSVTRLLRTRGFAVQNRVAVVVMYIGGASYTPPTGYATAPNL